ncbi:hypothetical protein Caci_2993 [Catenulispora acidiphila DSM 44928]|uniref:Uncharacterized protein n=1 Tax=Catenulispora acidiphila (strain DSM 44928 / JCM 14897 / NBRC 102108 / NRRL B-24433 / ID139908) TaxID=479433 RepID=C7Q310_CATAD|nr:hypothetical protein [Catenulispora acidiphila]ACU71902.1 hypothetical protein Caci_2993 [Catenulispora acidiphila DSM 44928]
MPAYKTGSCSVCGREGLRVLKNGTIGLRVTKRPDPHGSIWSPRCGGWGKPPKES